MAQRLAIAGAGGRMGRALLDACAKFPDLVIAAALEQASSPLIDSDAGQLSASARGVKIGAELASALKLADTLIDFTRPAGTLTHLAACRAAGVNMVIGTTGFSDEQKQAIVAGANDIAIVFAANMSIGVNVTLKLVEMATRALHDRYDIEIIEAHHKMKVDAPSGTALILGEVAAGVIGKPLAELAAYARHGNTGERRPGDIGFAAIRGGDIVGEHTVMYAGDGERVEIRHVATSRTNFANGAMAAARFLAGRKTGLFDMQDVLGLRN